MGHAWEKENEAVVNASVEDVWAAIATGPGLDSWFMGRNEVTPGSDGSVRTDLGGYVMESTVTGWEPGRRFAWRTDSPNGRFVAFEYLIEGRDQASTVVRVVASGFLPGDDWEAEFDALSKGGEMYFETLVAYLDHFAGRAATPVNVTSPPVGEWGPAWTTLRSALGLTAQPAVGDPVRVAPPGLAPIEGAVDFVNPHALGVRTDDALYRFVKSPFGSLVLGHHLFAVGIDEKQAAQAWQTWVAALYS